MPTFLGASNGCAKGADAIDEPAESEGTASGDVATERQAGVHGTLRTQKSWNGVSYWQNFPH